MIFVSDDRTMRSGANEPTKTEVDRRRPVPHQPGQRFSPGTMIGHYEVVEPLGQGGMGDVYLARDARLGRRVALKFLLQVNPKLSARFFVEARATAQVTHENIVALYDIAEYQGHPYMVLEYVPGKTLSTWLHERQVRGKTEPVPPAQAAEIMLPVVRALQCAHEAGIVHRDLKPANIMLTKSGTVKVLDFGVAKLIVDTATPTTNEPTVPERDASPARMGMSPPDLTEAGVLVGTRAYMAPEQWWGESIDGRTDIWAVGIMLYQMVTGDHPLAPLSPESLVSVTVRDKPMPSVLDLAPSVGDLGLIIDRCLRKPKDERLSSAQELAEALETLVRAQPSLRIAPRFSDKPPAEPRNDVPPSSNDTKESAKALEVSNQKFAGSSSQTRSRLLFGVAAIAALAIGGGVFEWRHYAPALATASSTVAGAAACVGSQCVPATCTSNSECLVKSEGKASICRKETSTCVVLEAHGCRVLADKQEVENDATLWIGAMYPYGPKGSFYGKQAARAVELARNDFRDLGGIPPVELGGKPRPIGVVLCDDAEEQKQVAKHLIESVRVPVILGFARSKEVMDLASEFFLPQGILALASNTASTLVDIPHLPGEPRLVFRVTTSAEMVSRPKAVFVEKILEPQLKSRGVLKGAEALRIALVRSNNTSGVSHADKLISLLHWNGKNALENGDAIQQFVVPDELERKDKPDVVRPVAQAIATFAPHIVIDAGVDPEPILLIEQQWSSTTRHRAIYLTSGSFSHPHLQTLVANFPDAAHRLFAWNTTISPAQKKYIMHYNETFTDEKSDPFLTNSAPYDAFYTAAYAIIALGDAPVTGKALSHAIGRLVPPGESIDVGPANIYKATKLLRDGKNIDLAGSQTSLDFDPETGDPTADFTVQCMDPAKHTTIESGLVYDAKTTAFVGALKCL